MDAEETATRVARVAEEVQPDGGYGDTFWNPETGAVFWVCGDWTSTEEVAAAREAFLAVPGVESFDYEAEARPSVVEADPWRQLYTVAVTAAAVPAGVPARVHYRESTDSAVSCGTCSYFDAGHCQMFRGKPAVIPSYVCDEWEAVKTADTSLSVEAYNRTLKAAYARVDALEAPLAAVLQPILERAGEEAAAAFTRRATDHFTAAAALAYDVTPSMAMVAVKPRPDEAAALADPDGVPAGVLHVTLAFLGDVDGDLGPVVSALAPVAATHGPLGGMVSGYGQFGEPANVGVLLPDVPGLVELRVAVTEALTAAEISYGRDHGFTPHVTVDATPEIGEMGEMMLKAGMPVTFDELLVVRGDTEVIPLPLTGTAPLTAAAGTPQQISAATADLDAAKRRLRAALGSADEDDIEAARAALELARVRLRGLAGQTPAWSAPAADELVDAAALVASLRTKTDPIRLALVESVMKPALAAAGVRWDVTNPLVARVLAQSGSQIVGIAETTQLNVMRIIRESYKEGLSIPDTATAIQAGMKEASFTRATLIARTSMVGAANGGSLAATQLVSQATGQTHYKMWNTAAGAMYPRHYDYDDLDGQTVNLGDTFVVGESNLQYPGDPEGPPEDVCNCRCSLSYTDDASELTDGASSIGE